MEHLWILLSIVMLSAGLVIWNYIDRHRHGTTHILHGFGHKHGAGVFSIDYYAYNSGIKNWNAGFKVVFAMSLLILGIVADNLYVSVIIIIITMYVTIGLGELSSRQYFHFMMIPIAFMIMGSIAIAINFSRVPMGDYCFDLHWFYIYGTKQGVIQILHLWGKAFGAISSMYMMSLSTPSSELIGVFRKLKVPAIMIELMHMIYRYIFILMDIQYKMKNSAESRMGFCDYKTSIRSFGMILGNLLVVSLKKANQYNDALDSRCYDGTLLFLEMEKPVYKKQIFCAGIVILYILIVWLFTK